MSIEGDVERHGPGNAAAIAAEAVRIVDAAEQRNVTARVVGGVGVWLCAPARLRHALEQAARNYGDIDLVCRGDDRRRLPELMSSLEYEGRKRFNALHGSARHIYDGPAAKVDVFFDRMQMCHTIDFSGRLALTSPHASPTDLLLHKLQIVEINAKDLFDAGALLAAPPDTGVDFGYITSLLSVDWGFWYTTTTNLRRLLDHLPSWTGLDAEDRRTIESQAGALLESLEASPKSRRWKARARVGPRLRWHEVVEEV